MPYLRLQLHLLLLLGAGSIGLAGPIISIQPSPATIENGSSVVLNVNILGITDLYAFQFDLAFDPAILSAEIVSEGPFLSSGGTTVFLPGAIDNGSGTVSFTADSLIGVGTGASGAGVLASIQFTAVGSGISDITFSNILLLDSNLSAINVDSINGTVTVTAQALPEPSTLECFVIFSVLLLAGKGRFDRIKLA